MKPLIATRDVKASDLERGMRLMVAGYNEADLITRVSRTSAGSHMIIELYDGRVQYWRPHSTMKVAA